MLATLATAAIGLVLLLAAGDALVRGAVNVALRLEMPPLLVGVMVVGFGTSAPELVATLTAALAGAPGIALGNVIGSNVANVLLILGLPAMLVPIVPSGHGARRTYLQMLAATLAFMALAQLGQFGRLSGVLLLLLFTLMIRDSIREALAHRTLVRNGQRESIEIDGADPHMSGRVVALLLVAGLAGLPLGAHLLVGAAAEIARTLGVGETAIGITLVALGTSLPELASTAAAALRGRADMALGNILGSNMFNLLGILGVTALVAPVPVPAEVVQRDLWVMLGSALLIGPVVLLAAPITRLGGAVLTICYLGYVMLALQ